MRPVDDSQRASVIDSMPEVRKKSQKQCASQALSLEKKRCECCLQALPRGIRGHLFSFEFTPPMNPRAIREGKKTTFREPQPGRRLQRSEAALALIKDSNRLAQIFFAEVGPEFFGHENFSIAQLPEQEVGEAHLA